MFVQSDTNAATQQTTTTTTTTTTTPTTTNNNNNTGPNPPVSPVRPGPRHHHHRHHRHNQNDEYPNLRIPAVEKYAYCLCLHVKPATIFIALIKLVKTFVFASIVLNSEFAVPDQISDFRQRSTAAAISIAMLVIVGSVSSLAIYAVISGRAALLMPLYAIMLCDFFFTLPTTYNRDLNEPAIVDPNFRELVNLNSQHSRYSLFIFSTFDMLIKIYFLCIIWKCYRYLRLHELILPLRFAAGVFHRAGHWDGNHYHHNLPGMARSTVINPSDLANSENMAPPSYDAIVTSIKSQPPNYEEAIKTSTNTENNPNDTIVDTSTATTTESTTTPALTQVCIM